jgi:hypothetical protein
MKKMSALLLALLSGCYYDGYDRHVALAPHLPPVTLDEAERMAAAVVSEATMLELVDQRGA